MWVLKLYIRSPYAILLVARAATPPPYQFVIQERGKAAERHRSRFCRVQLRNPNNSGSFQESPIQFTYILNSLPFHHPFLIIFIPSSKPYI